MACIVYHTDPASGRTYAYSSESYWDKDKKQPRSKRTYLGRVNPETGEIMHGRQNGRNYKPNRKADLPEETREEFVAEQQRLEKALSAKNEEIAALKLDIQKLQTQVRKMSAAFQSIARTVENATQ